MKNKTPHESASDYAWSKVKPDLVSKLEKEILIDILKGKTLWQKFLLLFS